MLGFLNSFFKHHHPGAVLTQLFFSPFKRREDLRRKQKGAEGYFAEGKIFFCCSDDFGAGKRGIGGRHSSHPVVEHDSLLIVIGGSNAALLVAAGDWHFEPRSGLTLCPQASQLKLCRLFSNLVFGV